MPEGHLWELRVIEEFHENLFRVRPTPYSSVVARPMTFKREGGSLSNFGSNTGTLSFPLHTFVMASDGQLFHPFWEEGLGAEDNIRFPLGDQKAVSGLMDDGLC